MNFTIKQSLLELSETLYGLRFSALDNFTFSSSNFLNNFF
ncbi:hypothetical protein LEP1GSC035_4435 [Leptospira noguchii str. 2007001578]|uniref:Uncharacterized protein n=2 Tax=Leptospira noguchii TaxID=28182 RepID=M6YSR9_9LEPT|nr:hypothetical protein LEP1GSC035_4435 [Leptospira noguchii str. 2007001578]EMO89403.1 hypothetical protein LEP1GSC024_1171 [Leptospira noguchii str. 2001034031]